MTGLGKLVHASRVAVETSLTPERIREMTAAGYWRNETLAQYLDRWATARPDQIAVVDGAGR